jgi:hypothetical protein
LPVCKVNFISDHHFHNGIRVCISLKLFEPFSNIGICLPARNVEYQANALRIPVIRTGNRAESFLSCRIPQDELEFHIVDFKKFNFEINSNSGWLVIEKRVFCESDQN